MGVCVYVNGSRVDCWLVCIVCCIANLKSLAVWTIGYLLKQRKRKRLCIWQFWKWDRNFGAYYMWVCLGEHYRRLSRKIVGNYEKCESQLLNINMSELLYWFLVQCLCWVNWLKCNLTSVCHFIFLLCFGELTVILLDLSSFKMFSVANLSFHFYCVLLEK